jgi:hypothetical protein
VPRVREKVIAVNLFLALCATKFLLIRINMLLLSQNNNILLKSHYRRPWKLVAKRLKPTRSPARIMKKTSRISL